MLEFLLFLWFPAAMAFAGAMDLFTMTIPNRISLGLILPIAWQNDVVPGSEQFGLGDTVQSLLKKEGFFSPNA